VEIVVQGAASNEAAMTIAKTIGTSPLVKTAIFGNDPNWGRILCAMGFSSARVMESKVDIGYSLPGSRKILYSLRRGRPTRVSFKALCRMTAPSAFDLHIHLHLGRAAALLYAADLTEAYVDFNKGDVSDPTTLGG